MITDAQLDENLRRLMDDQNLGPRTPAAMETMRERTPAAPEKTSSAPLPIATLNMQGEVGSTSLPSGVAGKSIASRAGGSRTLTMPAPTKPIRKGKYPDGDDSPSSSSSSSTSNGGNPGDGNGPDKGRKDKKPGPGGPPDSPSDGEGEGGSHGARRKKIREAEKLTFPPQPTAANFPEWKEAVRREIQRGSGRTDNKALRWVNEAFDVSADAIPDDQFDRFTHTERRRFGTLSAKCVDALLKK